MDVPNAGAPWGEIINLNPKPRPIHKHSALSTVKHNFFFPGGKIFNFHAGFWDICCSGPDYFVCPDCSLYMQFSWWLYLKAVVILYGRDRNINVRLAFSGSLIWVFLWLVYPTIALLEEFKPGLTFFYTCDYNTCIFLSQSYAQSNGRKMPSRRL